MTVAKRMIGVSRAIMAPDWREPFPSVTDLLLGDGDPRLTLSSTSGQNMYGCVPYPQAGWIDFASSTASSISHEAFARVTVARENFIARSKIEGPEAAFQASITRMRRDLLDLLAMDTGTELVLTASGTDAQLLALFLVKARLGTPLTAIVVGADQTGNGAGFAATGRHFSHATAHGANVAKGDAIGVLADGIRKVEIPFWDPDNGVRTLDEMDALILDAVRTATAKGEKVLLQAMDASKFAWRAPSDECLYEIARQWPDQVQVVVDACQMRTPRERLARLIGKGFMVLITGAKFFTGPPFSGGLLIPNTMCAEYSALTNAPPGLSAYTSRFDWPLRWALRSRLPERPNYGQWLRWEAAVEEMRLYFAVPGSFRDDAQAALAGTIETLIDASPHLRLLPYGVDRNHGGKNATLFAFVPHRNNVPLSPEETTIVYRALRRDLSAIGPLAHGADRDMAAAPCQIGQPVLLPTGEAALRISLSSRIIRNCWSPKAKTASQRIGVVGANAATVVQKLNFAIANIGGLS